jgi:phosphonate transport system permease protein
VATETIGNMGRLFTDELEEIDEGTIEGIRSTGAQSTQIVYFGMLSQVIRPFLAWTLYLVEGSIRMAVGLGLLGAGGLGYVLEMERGMFNYTNMMATILTIMILVMSVEIISQRTRSYLRGGDTDDSMGFLERLRTLPRRIVASIL